MAEVVDLFLELASIPSPPGEERAVADVVARYLRDLGLTVDEDAFGNLYARIEPTAEGTAIRWVSEFDPKYPGTGWPMRRALDGFVAKLANGLAEHATAVSRAR